MLHYEREPNIQFKSLCWIKNKCLKYVAWRCFLQAITDACLHRSSMIPSLSFYTVLQSDRQKGYVFNHFLHCCYCVHTVCCCSHVHSEITEWMHWCCFWCLLFVSAHVFVMNVRHENTSSQSLMWAFLISLSSLALYVPLDLLFLSSFLPLSPVGVRVGSWQTVRSFWMWRIWCGCGSRTGSACTRTSRSSTGDWCRRAWSKPKTPPRVKTQSKRWEPDQSFQEKHCSVMMLDGTN